MDRFVYGVGVIAAILFVLLAWVAYAPRQVSTYAQRLSECGAYPNGATQTVANTTRLFINLPKDLYPQKQLQIAQNGATAGYISNAGPYGEAFEAQGKPNCWSYYLEFDLMSGAQSGTVDVRSMSGASDVPDYHLRVQVENH